MELETKSSAKTLPINVDVLSRIGGILRSARGIDQILTQSAELIVDALQVDSCAVYLYENGSLVLKANKRQPDTEQPADKLNLGEGIAGTAAIRKIPIVVEDITKISDFQIQTEIKEQNFKSFLSIPMLDDDTLVGVMNINTVVQRGYSSEEQELAAFVANLLVGAIRSAQLYDDVVCGFREMTILHRTSQIINSVLDLDELLSIVSRICAEQLSTRGCILRLINPQTKGLEIRGYYGVDLQKIKKSTFKIGEGIPGRVVKEGKPIILQNVAAEMEFIENGGVGYTSVACVPLIARGNIIGTLGVFDKISPFSITPVPFDESDIRLISTIGNQVATAIENATLFAEVNKLATEDELRIREMSLLLEITNIMRSTLDLEEILYIILTSVTIGQGLGFNRAFLFLMDDDEKNLVGKMAVGPLTPDQAKYYWDVVDTKGKSLAEIIREYGLFNMRAGFKIDTIVKEISIPVHSDLGVLAKTVLEKKPLNVEDYSPPDEARESIFKELGLKTFAAVPLMAKDHVVGVVVVDNLVTREPVTKDDLNFLTLFANQAASAIEMAKLYKNLEDTNKRLMEARDQLVRHRTLATLGEFSAGIAHELRNPLVSIGGFAKRLLKVLPENTREHQYSKIIATEVEGLEEILGQILEFVAGIEADKKTVDVSALVEQVLVLFRETIEKHGIIVETSFDEGARYLIADEIQIRQLFINLIKNALEAMGDKGGTLGIRSTLLNDDEGGVGFEVNDTGCGIAPEDLERVFDPFFTRKPAGSGLGLSISSRIVEGNHGGRIFIDSKKDRGTSVLIWFPWSIIPKS